MQLVKNLLSVAAITLLMSSCGQDFKKTKGGMPYKLFPSKEGAKIESGNFVKAQVTQSLNDSVIFTTYDKLPVYFPVTAQSQPYDITEVLPTLKSGDSVYAVQLIDTFMARNPQSIPPTMKKGDKIITTIKIESVFKNAADAQKDEETLKMAKAKGEEGAVKEYLAKNNITDAQRTENGTYVQILQQGTGEAVTEGKYVSVMYKGSTFGGKVFDSNMDTAFGHTDPLIFPVGTGGMIKGFDEGVTLLKEGAKARMYIPSMLGYGAQPPSPEIKPFEHLIFDVEVLDVSAKAPAGAPGAPGGNMPPDFNK